MYFLFLFCNCSASLATLSAISAVSSALTKVCEESLLYPLVPHTTHKPVSPSPITSHQTQCLANFCKLAAYPITLSPSFCSLLWKQNRSAMTSGFGIRCVIKVVTSCSYVRSFNFRGATSTRSKPNVSFPTKARKASFFCSAPTL